MQVVWIAIGAARGAHDVAPAVSAATGRWWMSERSERDPDPTGRSSAGTCQAHVLNELQYRTNFFLQLLQSASQVAGALVAMRVDLRACRRAQRLDPAAAARRHRRVHAPRRRDAGVRPAGDDAADGRRAVGHVRLRPDQAGRRRAARQRPRRATSGRRSTSSIGAIVVSSRPRPVERHDRSGRCVGVRRVAGRRGRDHLLRLAVDRRRGVLVRAHRLRRRPLRRHLPCRASIRSASIRPGCG